MLRSNWKICLLLVLLFSCIGNKSVLKRRAFIGVGLDQVDDNIVVNRVIPRSSAQLSGLRIGDRILRIDDFSVRLVQDFVAKVKALSIGDSAKLVIRRDNSEQQIALNIKEFPREVFADFAIDYLDYNVGKTLRRLIVTRLTRAKNAPVVVLLGGLGCYSFDYGLDDMSTYRKLLYGLTEAGFVTVRIEKEGMGDNRGRNCYDKDYGFIREKENYLAGIKSLAKFDFIDSSRLYLIGHSIGGIIAPFVAKEVDIKGIIAVNTVGRSWLKYEVENYKRQLLLAGSSNIKQKVKLREICLEEFFFSNKGYKDLVARRAGCKEQIRYPISPKYIKEVAQLNIESAWQGLDVPSLVVYGQSDFVTSLEDVQHIAKISKKAKLLKLEGMDHFLLSAKDQKESFFRMKKGESSSFHVPLVKVLSQWVKSNE